MHIPDGFISAPVAAATWVASAGSLGYATQKVKRTLSEKQVPLMGVMGAFVFAAQMLNFRVAAGTSGHFLGAALVTLLLGPWAGMFVITAVLMVQAFIFQDGGIVALGANIFNMAIVGVWVSYGINLLLKRILGSSRSGTMASAFIAAWFSVICAATACSAELALSGSADAAIVFTAMGAVHALIGIGEGLITSAVLAFLLGVRPDLVAIPAVKV